MFAVLHPTLQQHPFVVSALQYNHEPLDPLELTQWSDTSGGIANTDRSRAL
ncbi:hypothetical protein CRES_2055 [Corynebacterium resistens DSM 45100]|uniref:Uncharacterized protein n=1 Tax=Corynebacterium resistens (strain DSM 45100 / JCM 12819 / GTC 2026 / SICGH 158) TaxID=662755 RepID=F8DXS1_CORRG|nr:hypothetical protein CRES_2055 [Corynebacterium resistens DSM 45100]